MDQFGRITSPSRGARAITSPHIDRCNKHRHEFPVNDGCPICNAEDAKTALLRRNLNRAVVVGDAKEREADAK